MAKIRINPEELELLEEGGEKEPGAIDKLTTFVRDNATIIGGGLVILAFVLIFIGYQDSSERQELVQGNIALMDAVDEFTQGQSGTTWASPERQAAMLEVVTAADNIISQYPDTSVALEADFLKGSAYFQAGNDIQEIIDGGARNNQLAIDTFTAFLSKVDPGSFEHARGALALAYAHENNFFVTNDTNAGSEAISFYTQAEKSDPYGFITVDAKLGRARILAKSNNTDEAIAIYREILDQRFEPIVRPDDSKLYRPDGSINRGNQMIFTWQQFRELNTTLTNVARIELARLGVDVDEEYPIYADSESEDSEES